MENSYLVVDLKIQWSFKTLWCSRETKDGNNDETHILSANKVRSEKWRFVDAMKTIKDLWTLYNKERETNRSIITFINVEMIWRL